jgi:tRNA A-37 threonylcarbamoyl transferase component Bud32
MTDGSRAASVWNSSLEGRYRLGGRVGSGAVADVFRAEDVVLGRPVAVKVFRADHDPVALHRFTDEARALARLSHPGLVPIFDAGIDDDRPYLVMRLIDGLALRDRLRNRALATDETVGLGGRLATALVHVHSCGLVHRDIKPSNILLDECGRPYLVDFGIALAADAARLTASNEIIGTAAYLAPEQVLGEDIGPAADIYALGLVLLECLTGALVYPGSNKVEVAVSRLHRSPRIPAGLPAGLPGLLAAMTDTEPAGRPSAQHCADTLLAMHQQDSAYTTPLPAEPVRTTVPAVVPAPSQTRSLRVRRTLVRSAPAAALTLALAGAMAGFVLAFSTPIVLTGLPTDAAVRTSPVVPKTSRSQAPAPTTRVATVPLVNHAKNDADSPGKGPGGGGGPGGNGPGGPGGRGSGGGPGDGPGGGPDGGSGGGPGKG